MMFAEAVSGGTEISLATDTNFRVVE